MSEIPAPFTPESTQPIPRRPETPQRPETPPTAEQSQRKEDGSDKDHQKKLEAKLQGLAEQHEQTGTQKWNRLEDEDKAQHQLKLLDQARTAYKAKKEAWFGQLPDRFTDKLPPKLAKVIAFSQNLTRILPDALTYLKGLGHYQEAKLRNAEITLDLVSREDLLSDGGLLAELVEVGDQKQLSVLRDLLDRELTKEINCTRLAVIRGVDGAQFARLIRESGSNPATFLSDPRGENAGRVAEDLRPIDGHHPLEGQVAGLTEDEMTAEMKHFQALYPEAPSWAPWSKWRTARNHGVIYQFKGQNGEPILISPMHIDPLNSVVGIKNMLDRVSNPQALFGELRNFVTGIFTNKKSAEGVWRYHASAAGTGDEFIGTGLYELGLLHLAATLNREQTNGKFKSLTIKGLDQVQSTGSIIKDDRVRQIHG